MSRQGPAQLSKRETWVLASSSNEQSNGFSIEKCRLAARQLSIVGNGVRLRISGSRPRKLKAL